MSRGSRMEPPGARIDLVYRQHPDDSGSCRPHFSLMRKELRWVLLVLAYAVASYMGLLRNLNRQAHSIDDRDAAMHHQHVSLPATEGGNPANALYALRSTPAEPLKDTRSLAKMQNHTSLTLPTPPKISDSTAFVEVPKTDLDFYSNNIWIYGVRWAEGLAGWQSSLAEVLTIAKRLNATFVEPAIENGRLVECDKGNVRLFDVFDEAAMKAFHPKIASCSEFQKVLLSNPKTFDLCFNKNGPCTTIPSVPSIYISYRSETLDEALSYASQHPDRIVLIQLHHYWKWSTRRLKLEGHTDRLLDWETAGKVRLKHFKFHQQFRDHLTTELQEKRQINLAQSTMLHWRAEITGIDYMKCAKMIAKAHQVLGMPPNSTLFVATSMSLSDQKKSWGGSQQFREESSTSDAALKWLFSDPTRTTLDTMISSPIEDLVGWAVMDIVLAEMSGAFITCCPTCKGTAHSICTACNHVGHFAMEFIRRRSDQVSTYPCWPQNSSDLDPIAKMHRERALPDSRIIYPDLWSRPP